MNPKPFNRSLAVGLGALLGVFALGTPGALAQQASPEGTRFLVHLQHEPGAQLRFLEDLAALRRTGRGAEIPSRVEHQLTLQRLGSSSLEAGIAELGARIEERLFLEPSLVVRGADAQSLARLPGVSSVEPERYLAPASLNVALNAQHHDTKGANLLLDGQGQTIEGTGVVIGLIDTGMDTKMGNQNRPHLAFYRDANTAQQIPGGIGGSRILSAETGGVFSSGFEDIHGHGTRMASIALGFKYNNNPGVSNGAAPDALVRSYRVDSDGIPGIASFLSMNAALNKAVGAGDVGVILLAWDGTRNPELGSNPSIDAAVLAGVPVILSAGNDGSGAIYHGSFNGLPVGASFTDTKQAYTGPFFKSAVGPMLDGRRYPKLLAIGEDLTSAVPDDETTSVASYGTSGAAAITAGTVALMLQAVPSLTPRQVRALLLDTSTEVTLGDDRAAGYGYLQSKRAVQLALAGAAVEGAIANLDSYTWPVSLNAGQGFKTTVVWDQVQSGQPYNDLDLVLRDPAGAIVAEARGYHDTVEQIRYQAPVAGTYQLTLELVSTHPSLQSLTYAITGVPLQPAGIVPNLCTAVAPIAFSFQQGPLHLPAPDFFPDELSIVVKGCKLNQVNAVKLDGNPVSFALESEKALRVLIPSNASLGVHIVTLELLGGGFLQGLIGIDNGPVLGAPYTIGSGDGGLLSLKHQPGEPFWILFSLSQLPTSFPGLLELAIGNGGSNLFLLYSGTLDVNGRFQVFINGGPNYNPANLIGKKAYFQGAVFDLLLGTFPLLPSNQATSLFIF